MSTQAVNVTLPSEIIYVSGTVNGAAYTWTLVDGAWQAVADRASDDTYLIALTAIDSGGASTSYSLTLYYGMVSLITDRTKADADRVQTLAAKGWDNLTTAEKAEWMSNPKGAYNATDLNRVGSAMRYVADRLTGYGYAVEVNPKTDWQRPDIPTPAQMTQYLTDVAALRSAVSILDTTPERPGSMDDLGWQEANNIEQILVDVDMLLTNMAAAWYYSGELFAGEV